MKRRIILIVVLVLVIGVASVGTWWYVRQNTGVRLLARADLAMRAQKFERALELLDRYIQDRPKDWRGHYEKARALVYMGRYAEARGVLNQAKPLAPEEVTIDLAMADTYSLPARRALAEPQTARDEKAIDAVLDSLIAAGDVLDRIPSDDPRYSTDVAEAVGLNDSRLARAHRTRAMLYDQQAKVAEAARAREMAKLKGEAKARELGFANEAEDRGIERLLAVVKADPSRPRAAETLIDLCMDRRDEKSLALAREAIMSYENPPPLAAAKLVFHELDMTLEKLEDDARNRKLIETRQFLRSLLAEHPDEVEVKLLAARVAVLLADHEDALGICQEILASEPRHAVARLLKGRILLAKDEPAEAERLLFALKTDFSAWPEAHYAYGQAAMAASAKMGRPELEQVAKQAFRTVTELDPRHPGARRMLARLLMRDQFYDQAFQDAQEYYRAHPDDPGAVRLMAEAAVRTEQPELARGVLDAAVAQHANRPDILVAAADGYSMLGERTIASSVIDRASKCTPTTRAERLAVARAWAILAGASEKAGGLLQAIEEYRAATKLDPGNEDYRVALAKALLNSGDMDQAEVVLESISPANSEANSLRMQVRIAKGEPFSAADMLQQIGGDSSSLRVAQIYLGNGQVQMCVDFCLAELEKDPDEIRLRSLLGLAYLSLGQMESCIRQWTLVLQTTPDDWSAYQRLADVLMKTQKPSDVRKSLAAIEGTRSDLVDLAVGWLLGRAGDFPAAAEVYAGLAENEDAPELSRDRARLSLALALAAGGQSGEALRQLDELARAKAWRQRALRAKADLLIRLGRRNEAAAVLAELRGVVAATRDPGAFQPLVGLYMRMRQLDKALDICDQVEAMAPEDARTYLMRAGVLQAAGRIDESLVFFEKAIELSAGDISYFLAMSRALEGEQRPTQVLGVLERLEDRGQAGRLYALFERGSAYLRWGLSGRALMCFDELAEAGYSGNPALQLGAGLAYGRLGQKDKARAVLRKISAYVPQYIPAQEILADLAETPEEKLQILRALDKTKPGEVRTLVAEMDVLMGAGRAGEAVGAFEAFCDKYVKDGPVPPEAALLAIQSMLKSGNMSAADALAERMVAQKPVAKPWRQIAILMSMMGDPPGAAALLPPADQADPYEALLGLACAVLGGAKDSTGLWLERIEAIGRVSSPLAPAISRSLSLLAALSAGRTAQGEAKLTDFSSTEFVGPSVAEELVSFARGQPEAASAEAAKLIGATLAIDHGLGDLAKVWTMQLLKARPSSQWAAALTVHADRSAGIYREVLELLGLKDCPLALRIQALAASEQGGYDQAAQLLAAAAKTEDDNPVLVREQAIALERAGRGREAIGLYEQAWAMARDPIAANNGAYLICRLYSDDPGRLAEAYAWVESLVRTAPNVPAFRDTKGWVCFLLGRNEEARQHLWQAVVGLPNSLEVHYHVGAFEADAGDKKLGRWHLEAAVRLGRMRMDGGGDLVATEREALERAQNALAAMGAE